MKRLLEILPGTSGTSKGENGRVGIVAGSVGYAGQPTLTGLAALRSGADVAKAFVSEPLFPIVGSHSPNLLVDRYSGETITTEAADRALELAEWSDALVIGPGLTDATDDAVRRLVSEAEVPVVVDALAIEPALDADHTQTVFTPDSAEESRITADYGSIEAFTEQTDAVCVVTGEEDHIFADGERTVNETGSSALTVAGTGDTLTGIIAALLSQGLDRRDAVELGAWILGKSGELATVDQGIGVVATDVIEAIPKTIH